MHFSACQFDYLAKYAFWQGRFDYLAKYAFDTCQFDYLAKYAYFAPKMS